MTVPNSRPAATSKDRVNGGWKWVLGIVGAATATLIAFAVTLYVRKIESHVELPGHPVIIERVGGLNEKLDRVLAGQEVLERQLMEIQIELGRK